jgi:octaprenyl-diphosphate synthase
MLVAHEMAQVDGVISDRLSTGVPLVAEVAKYIISAGGKRLRPALLLLMSGALGFRGDARFTLAAVVEFIHTATLLHDDVVDDSTLRRGRATANQVFGNPASVLVGDFLYSRAFQMMVEVGAPRVMAVLAETTNVIAEGEVLQLMNVRDASVTEDAYLRVIRSKTAKLFEASARLAPILADADSRTEAQCAAYGQALGTAFQVIDDVLDYDGTSEAMGKNLGDDLREGKLTLPLIFAMRLASPGQRSMIQESIETGAIERLGDIIDVVRATGALEQTRLAAHSEALRAVEAAGVLPTNPYSEALIKLAADLVGRQK